MRYLEFGLPLIILISRDFPTKISQMARVKHYFLLFIIFVFGTLRTLNYITSGATHQAEKAPCRFYIASRAGMIHIT